MKRSMGVGGRHGGRLPLGVSSPRRSLIGRSRGTLDCRHGEAVLAVEPGARRRGHLFSRSSRRPFLVLVRERDGDALSTMRGIGRASEGDRGLPADRVRPQGSIAVGAVPDHDARPFGAVGVAGGRKLRDLIWISFRKIWISFIALARRHPIRGCRTGARRAPR
jgi:hypothetical protein